MGFLLDFLSHAAIVGFTAGAAIVIGLQQLKGLFGIHDFTNKTDLISVFKSVSESLLHHPVPTSISLISSLYLQLSTYQHVYICIYNCHIINLTLFLCSIAVESPQFCAGVFLPHFHTLYKISGEWLIYVVTSNVYIYVKFSYFTKRFHFFYLLELLV